MPKERPKGLLDELDDMEARRGKKKEKPKPKKDDDLDLGKVW